VKNSVKMSFCLKAVTTLQDDDLSALTTAIEAYVSSGITVNKAEKMAVSDVLAQVKTERKDILALLEQQHPDAFKEDAPAAEEKTSELVDA
jgi:hypothetical protein